ncbi:nitrite reductase (NAD(P)H) small subunit, partial [Dickeya dianthicola]
RGIIGDVAGEPVVISPLYKKRLRLRDGVSPDDSQLRVRAWPVRLVQDRIWVANEPMAVVAADMAEAL